MPYHPESNTKGRCQTSPAASTHVCKGIPLPMPTPMPLPCAFAMCIHTCSRFMGNHCSSDVVDEGDLPRLLKRWTSIFRGRSKAIQLWLNHVIMYGLVKAAQRRHVGEEVSLLPLQRVHLQFPLRCAKPSAAELVDRHTGAALHKTQQMGSLRLVLLKAARAHAPNRTRSPR